MRWMAACRTGRLAITARGGARRAQALLRLAVLLSTCAGDEIAGSGEALRGERRRSPLTSRVDRALGDGDLPALRRNEVWIEVEGPTG